RGIQLHEVCAEQIEYRAAVSRPLRADLPREVRLRHRAYVRRELQSRVAELRALLHLLEIAGRRRELLRENHVARCRVIIRDSEIGLVVEESEVRSALELAGALRQQARGRLRDT